MAAAVVAGALLLHPARTPPGAWAAGPRIVTFSVVEAAIPDMRNALQQGRVTSRELVTQYLTRIATYEDLLNAVITVNPTRSPRRRRATAIVRRAASAGRCTASRSH
jgi:hypothetical protein